MCQNIQYPIPNDESQTNKYFKKYSIFILVPAWDFGFISAGVLRTDSISVLQVLNIWLNITKN